MLTGNAMVCGLIGSPVGHSLSPFMHNFIASAMNQDYIYVPCAVESGDLEKAVQGAYALGFTGLNVTVPYKNRVIPYLAETDGSAKSIGAVNTLVRQENGYKGYNTDAEGLFRAMNEHGLEIRGRDCLILGAGGTARTAAYLMVRERARSITILNRSMDHAAARAEQVREQLAARGTETGSAEKEEPLVTVRTLSLEQWEELPGGDYLAVQTTNVGMYPRTEAAVIEAEGFYRKISQAADVIYTPAKTRFMELAERAGCRVMGGLDMLIYQGIAAYELWNPSVKVSAEVISRIREGMEERLHG